MVYNVLLNVLCLWRVIYKSHSLALWLPVLCLVLLNISFLYFRNDHQIIICIKNNLLSSVNVGKYLCFFLMKRLQTIVFMKTIFSNLFMEHFDSAFPASVIK